MKPSKALAIDLGASNGRAILGIFNGEKIETKEIHRFSNDPVKVNGVFYWDVLRLFFEIKQGIVKCIADGNKDISSIGIDSWGVSFGLLDEQGDLISNPLHYRNVIDQETLDSIHGIISREKLFRKTGLLTAEINTIYLLYQLFNKKDGLLKQTKTMLLMPDLIGYFLTGKKAAEYTIASTTQFLSLINGEWSDDILRAVEIPKSMFSKVIDSGTMLGTLKDEIREELNTGDISLISVCGHDTASAVTAVPTEQNEFAFISCGTWSVIGTELEKPLINNKVLKYGFSNEGSYGQKVKLLRNITGLWILQSCIKTWSVKGSNYTYQQLNEAVLASEKFRSIIDPDDPMFFEQADMPSVIDQFLERTGQPETKTVGDTVRCILISLALKYRYLLEQLEEITDHKYEAVHMVGGGTKNQLLCQFTADILRREVIAGPAEATVTGNLIVQFITLGLIKDIGQGRKLIRQSAETLTYLPKKTQDWDELYLEAVKLY